MAQVDNLTVTCIDFRFRPQLAQWMTTELEDKTDLVAIAGVSQAILDEGTQAAVLKQIDIADRLHSIKTVHLIDHIDCGAYGGSAQFNGDKNAEIAMHKEELEKAKVVIAEKFPSLQVELHIADFGGMV
jgi:carbonic anhydrase